MIRKTIFWTHLVAGLAAGLVIFTMSLTGVLLTYERQILHWAEARQYVPADEQTTPMRLEQLLGLARISTVNPVSTVTLTNNSGAPVSFRAGRDNLALNPYSGEEMHIETPETEGFFRWVTSFHRWFNVQGEGRNTARAITGASNLIFLFLILSGLYLWLPSIYKWVMFRSHLFFSKKALSGKARDYNWHHVFGFWTAIPLAVVVATAVVFSYPWANSLVYTLNGEEAPVRGRGGPPGGAGTNGDAAEVMQGRSGLPLDSLLTEVNPHIQGWKTLSVTLPAGSADTSIAVDYGNGAQPHLRETLTVNSATGEIIETTGFDAQSPGQRARFIIRFLHTGEVLGFWGQTIAGIVSLTSLIMVWTGFALAWRRLISPLLRRRAQAR